MRGRGLVNAHLPNPGRLWELLLPGTTLHVVPRPSSGTGRAPLKVVAVERDGAPIVIDTHLSNAVARTLIERELVPELAGTRIERGEVPLGKSRLDFLLRKGRRKIYLEVKSCTLFGNGVAMFPDAVTERGRRHLTELAARPRGTGGAVLFLVHTPRVRWFMPDYHTDLEFSRRLLEVRKRVGIYAVAIEWRPDLSLGAEVRSLQIPWRMLAREAQDRGSYLLLLRLDDRRRISVGRLGVLGFPPGYYIYVGSSRRHLTARLARHQRLRKRHHWHIDYLRQQAKEVVALPIRSSRNDECMLASRLSGLCAAGPAGFGCSDCSCHTHLFCSASHPLEQPGFHELLQHFRMRPPGD